MSLYPRLDNVDGDNHVPSPHFVEQFFLNLRNTLPQELQAFIEQTKIIVQRELREAADANRELNRWGLTKSIFKAFRETGSALFLLAYLYPTLCRTNENIIGMDYQQLVAEFNIFFPPRFGLSFPCLFFGFFFLLPAVCGSDH
jgi:hypothetical protein